MVSLYGPLDTKRNHIRGLIVLPGVKGEFDDPIHATLETVSLDESPNYEALSYVWGEPTDSKSMVLNGEQISIRPSLDCALRHLRRPDSYRILWVDAVCINQDDLDERAEQLKLMRRVYQTASTVLVWLGPRTDDTDAAMRSIEKFDKPFWQTYDFQVKFMEILYRPWFTRIWVVQEFVLGKSPTESPRIGCGNVWVPWISFMTAWAHFNDNLPLVQKEYQKQYQHRLGPTFQPSWNELSAQMQITPVGPSEEGILTGLRSAFGDDFLQHTGHVNVPGLFQDIRANPKLWATRYGVIRYCSYESPEAKAYWRWLKLKRVVPAQYYEFLMHARGTLTRKQEPLSFETILKGTMNLRSTDPRDKIYGILGLVSGEARESIPVDCKSGCFSRLRHQGLAVSISNPATGLVHRQSSS